MSVPRRRCSPRVRLLAERHHGLPRVYTLALVIGHDDVWRLAQMRAIRLITYYSSVFRPNIPQAQMLATMVSFAGRARYATMYCAVTLEEPSAPLGI